MSTYVFEPPQASMPMLETVHGTLGLHGTQNTGLKTREPQRETASTHPKEALYRTRPRARNSSSLSPEQDQRNVGDKGLQRSRRLLESLPWAAASQNGFVSGLTGGGGIVRALPAISLSPHD